MPDLNHNPAAADTQQVLSPGTIALLRNVPILATLNESGLHCLDGATEKHLRQDELLIRQGELTKLFWILLEGSLNVSAADETGHEEKIYVIEQGGAIGEVPLLASIPSGFNIRALEPSNLLMLTEDQFWQLMNACPGVRKAVLGNMAMRLAKMQSATFQQEKMAALGTMAAGLMHELNNPGSAARRASSQLRQNLLRMHQLTASFARTDLTAEQKNCMYDLQNYALQDRPRLALDSLQQADAEEALTQWMESAHIPDAWKLAPTLASIGIEPAVLECARHSFAGAFFGDALSWLEALVSSMQLVGIIEESIGRVTDLVHAVKSYAYEGRGQKRSIDINDSIHATLIILGHKIREKQLTLDKIYGPNLPLLETGCQGLNQIWTNLLDNAIDAAPQQGRLVIKTWSETVPTPTGPREDLCILIADNGEGIPSECQAHIFDPFFTTKPVGVGTGLGLGIVYRIVEQCGGNILFSSTPGETEFVVRLPAQRPNPAPAPS